MRPEAQKYLTDIQVAADRIARFCAGKQFEQYLADEMLVDDKIVWGTIENHLGPLRKTVADLLASG